MHVFENRTEAGQLLARELEDRLRRAASTDLVVLGLPRGGVPVAFEVAAALDAPLDVLVVRKLGVPAEPELAMGAIGEHDAMVLDDGIVERLRVSESEVRRVETAEREVLERRVAQLRAVRPPEPLAGRTAIVVDDGVATGSTARLACRMARELGAARVVLAVPVAPADTLDTFTDADEVVCLASPHFFLAVGRYYRDFSATKDDDVVRLLEAAVGGRGQQP
ncbi:phosphoribosyltransferase [Sinomonas gamaensis]|uniref:phosphoribosyltransferase n=1 Tax=Sinomonas gamaensis TaxID=2565624 RepID=UPI001107F455|nr:phosphoribosyltransferase family protein [Sinomonas gamaensis]